MMGVEGCPLCKRWSAGPVPTKPGVTARPNSAARAGREVLLEFQQVGGAVKVTALDPVTQIEVSIQGPATAGEAALGRTAIAKLEYVLSRRQKRPAP